MSTQKQIWTLLSQNLQESSTRLLFEEEEHHYAFHVLRLTESTEVEIANGKGLKATGIIKTIHKKLCEVEITSITSQKRKKPAIHLWLAAPKPATLEEVVANASEMGVCALHIFKSERGATKAPFKREKIERLSLESVRIHKGSFASEIFLYESLEDFYQKHIATLEKEDEKKKEKKRLILFCNEAHVYHGNTTNNILRVLQEKYTKNTEEICILIGPEASFSQGERLFLQKNVDYEDVSLGNHILRVPNAVSSALGVVLNFRESLPCKV